MIKVCWLLILVLLLGYFVGCQQAPGSKGPIENEDGTLADWMKEEIEQHWGKTLWYEQNHTYGVRYYGTEDGYVFLFSHANAQWAVTKIIGEYEFTHSSDFNLFAYKDGTFHKIEDLYKEDVLSKECIKNIYSAHCAYEMAA